MNTEPIPQRRRWWLYLLCVFGMLLLVGGSAFIALALYWNSLVKTYASSRPQPLPHVENAANAQSRLKTRWAEFQKSIMAKRPTPPFELTADDLNAFAASNPDFKDKFQFFIEQDQLRGKFSIPLGARGPSNLKGKYLNGQATFKLGFTDNWLSLHVASMEANGKPIPHWLLSKLQKQNFLKNLENNAELTQFLDNIESVGITNNTIVVQPGNLQ
jgi:hypothetical protein